MIIKRMSCKLGNLEHCRVLFMFLIEINSLNAALPNQWGTGFVIMSEDAKIFILLACGVYHM